jgi:hypothetical protein
MLKITVRHKLALAAAWALSMTGTSAHGDIIHACVLPTTGPLRIIDANKSCSPNERAIEWVQIGPAGPAGPAGLIGPAGPEGPKGDLGPAAAVRVVTGTDGVSCAENEVLVCASGSTDGAKCATPGTAATGLCVRR